MSSPQLGASPSVERMQELLREHYGLGAPCGIEEIRGGYCNRSYRVTCLGGSRLKRYFLRQYCAGTTPADLLFEHALLSHLHRKGFDLSAQVLDCRSGGTWLEAALPHSPGTRQYWALFTYLEGEDAYTWTRTDLSSSEIDSAAQVLARFHAAGSDFVAPPGAGRRQPPIVDLLSRLTDIFGACLNQAGSRSCDLLFRSRFEHIVAAVDTCRRSAEGFEGMPRLPVHGDYHPGNLKYAGGKVTGLFDFDWSKIDYRLFDVALALVYFCATWDRSAPPALRTGKMQRFLAVYDRDCVSLGPVPPLGPRETANLPAMLSAANLYVLNWDLTDYYAADAPDDAEYLFYLRHNIGLMDWLASCGGEVESLVARNGRSA